MKIAIAITGASGTIYAEQLIAALNDAKEVSVIYVVMTANAIAVAEHELGANWQRRLQIAKMTAKSIDERQCGHCTVGASQNGSRSQLFPSFHSPEPCSNTSAMEIPDVAAGLYPPVMAIPDVAACSSSPALPIPDVAAGSYPPVMAIPDLAACSNSPALPIPDLAAGSNTSAMQTPELVVETSTKIVLFDNSDFFTPIASGSAAADAMVIVPCSMGMVGRIANGISDDLISRAADVMIKERRLLIVVPRESPMSTIHLRNMLTMSESGAVVMPAAPSFYHQPTTIVDLTSSVVERILQQLKIANVDSYRWASGRG